MLDQNKAAKGKRLLPPGSNHDLLGSAGDAAKGS